MSKHKELKVVMLWPEGVDPANWREMPDPEGDLDNDENTPCPAHVRDILGFDPDDLNWKRSEQPVDNAFGGAVGNAFCPTGEGGGQDNSCSPKSKGKGRAESGSDTTPEELKSRLEDLKEKIAKRAQEDYNEWEQDEEGMACEIGTGGICDQIAWSITSVVTSEIGNVEAFDGGQPGDDHAFPVFKVGDKAYAVDIPPGVYEEGGGYNWKKIPDVKIRAQDVDIYEVDAGELTDNAFCPTGEGGGQDNSCAPERLRSRVMPPMRKEYKAQLTEAEVKRLKELNSQVRRLKKVKKESGRDTFDEAELKRLDKELKDLGNVAYRRHIAGGGKSHNEISRLRKAAKTGLEDTGEKKTKEVGDTSLEALRARLKGKNRVTGEASREAMAIMEEFKKPGGRQKEHGMRKPETMDKMKIGDLEVYWPQKRPVMAAPTIRDIISQDLHPALAKSNGAVYISTQRNKGDRHWASVFKMKGFRATATGGDGNIVVYDTSLDGGGFAHESGHNLAKRVWGNTTPPLLSDYGKAQEDEPPVSDYGSKSRAEDFAEACKLYSGGNPHELYEVNPREYLRKKFPRKYAALEALLEKYK